MEGFIDLRSLHTAVHKKETGADVSPLGRALNGFLVDSTDALAQGPLARSHFAVTNLTRGAPACPGN